MDVSTLGGAMRGLRQRTGRQSAGFRATPASLQGEQPITLLELVEAVGDETHDEREVIATVVHMLRTGSATLRGSFREVPPIAWVSRES